jgi:hypothetical protein
MKIFQIALFSLAAFAVAARADASTLYASTASSADGELYIINKATGAVVQDIGPLNDATGNNYSITGLAFHPTTGVLYGSTGNNNTAAQATLVTINPATAAVTVVGAFLAGPVSGGGNPATMADLGFNAAGTLYGIGSVGGPQLYSINIATGKATQVGAGSGLASTSGGGLAISPGGVFNGTPTSTRFGTYNSVTGAYTNIAAPTRPLGGAYAALAYDGGVLYGLDLGPDSAGFPTQLVTIDPATAAVTNGPTSIPHLDAIAFRVPEPGTLALVLAGLASLSTRKRR